MGIERQPKRIEQPKNLKPREIMPSLSGKTPTGSDLNEPTRLDLLREFIKNVDELSTDLNRPKFDAASYQTPEYSSFREKEILANPQEAEEIIQLRFKLDWYVKNRRNLRKNS